MMAASNGPTLWQSSHGKVWRDFIQRQEEKCSHRTEDKLWLPVFAGSLISPRFLLPPSSHVIYMSRFVLQLPSFSIIAIVSFLCVFSVYLVDLDLSFFPLRHLGIKLSTIAIVLCFWTAFINFLHNCSDVFMIYDYCRPKKWGSSKCKVLEVNVLLIND